VSTASVSVVSSIQPLALVELDSVPRGILVGPAASKSATVVSRLPTSVPLGSCASSMLGTRSGHYHELHWQQHQHHVHHQCHLDRVSVFDVPSVVKIVYKHFDYKTGKHVSIVYEKWIKACVLHVI
jgi:hypothetical protein